MKVSITGIDHYGRGICKINDKICFVPFTMPLEEVDIKIVKESKKYLIGEATKYYKRDKQHINSICKYYPNCGGCNLMHMDFSLENKFKTNKVKELVNKFTNINSDVVKNIISKNEYNYRNKIVLHIKNKKLGLYKNNSNELVPISTCYLLNEKLNEIIPILEKIVQENNITKITLKIGNKTNEIMMYTDGKVDNYFDLLKYVKVIYQNNTLISKEKYITSYIKDKKYLVTRNSFFQVNEKITEELYGEILNYIEKIKARNVLDLYCGVGSIGIFIADKVDKVFGVEIVDEAISIAKDNIKLNNVKNIDFQSINVDNFKTETYYDTIIVDPPRSGLSNSTIKLINEINPNNLIYVSCDPVTLCRDLNLLSNNYDVLQIQPYNMFPKTYHVECACILKLR